LSAAQQLPEATAEVRQLSPALEWGQGAILATTLGLLMFGPLAFGAVEPWSLFVLQAGSALLIGAWLVRSLLRNKLELRWNPALLPMTAMLALMTGQLMLPHWSAYRYATYASLLIYLSYATIVFLLIQTLTRTRHVRRAAMALGSYGVAIASFAIIQNLSSPGKLYWVRAPRFGGWIYGPYVNHNHYAGLMEMLTPIPLVFAFTRYARGRKKWAAASAAALMGASIFLSGSRGGMAAFALQVALFFWFVFRERAHGRVASVMATFLIASLAFVGWIGGSEVSKRITTLSPYKHSELAADMRRAINRDAIHMFTAHPILGFGAGAFGEVYPQFRSIYTNSLIDHAHNDYLELLVETGVIGFGLGCWLIWASFRSALRKVHNWPSDVNGAVSLSALLGIIGILVHSFVDFNLQIPANAALFYALCGIAAMDARFKNPMRGHRRRDLAEDTMNLEI
jgi:O-antigen ligase